MKIPFPFEAVLCFGWLGAMLLLGVALRAHVRFFQRFLIPSCILGGVVGLVLVHLGVVRTSVSLLETFAYHLFVLSFISIGLTPNDKPRAASGGGDVARGSIWMALMEGVTFSLQAVIGGGIVLLYGLLGKPLFPTFGFLLPLGFTEGPGQALSIGKVWEGCGFQYGASIGLTIAAIGFFFAFFVGVPLANRGIRKGRALHTPRALSSDVLAGLVPKQAPREPAGEQTTHAGNLDTLAFHMALVGGVYLLSYGLVLLLAAVLPVKLAEMLWGFLFFFGMVVALLVRATMVRLGAGHLINPGMQRRITGWSVDFLLTATIMAIQLVVVWEYLLPILLTSVLGGVVTTVAVVYLGNRIWSLNLERTMAIYGTVTGTVSTGLLLLRILDPEFQTKVALELGLMNLFVVPVILGSMLLISAPVLWNWSLGITVAVFAALLAACLAALRLLGMWGPRKA